MEFKQYASLIKHIALHVAAIGACIAGGTKIRLTYPPTTADGAVTVRIISVDKDAIDHITQPCTIADGTVTGLHLYPSTSPDNIIDLGHTIIVTDDPNHKDQCHNGFAYDKKKLKLTAKTFFPSGSTVEALKTIIENAKFKIGPVDTTVYKDSRADYNLWSDCLIGKTIARLLVCLQRTKSVTSFKLVSTYPRPTTDPANTTFGIATLSDKDAQAMINTYLATIAAAANANKPALAMVPAATNPAPTLVTQPRPESPLEPLDDVIKENKDTYIRKKFDHYNAIEPVLNRAIQNNTYNENRREVFDVIIEKSSDDERKQALKWSIEKDDPVLVQLLIDNETPVTPSIKKSAAFASAEIQEIINQS